MIRSANQFKVTDNQVGDCVAVTSDQFFRPSANTGLLVPEVGHCDIDMVCRKIFI